MIAPPEKLILLVCGGREFTDRQIVYRTLDAITKDPGKDFPRPGLTVVHGGCPRGADKLADDWCQDNGVNRIVFHARWNTEGRGAGIIRNGRMLDTMKPNVVLAFPGGNGTANMVGRAKKAGYPVVVEIYDIPSEEQYQALGPALFAAIKEYVHEWRKAQAQDQAHHLSRV